MINHNIRTLLKSLKFTHLAILLGTIILFSHCEKDAEEFGSDVIASRDSVPVLKDTLFNFNTFLDNEPKIRTKNTSKLLIGNIKDDYFGQTISYALGEFFLSSRVDSGTTVSPEDVKAEIIISYDEIFGIDETMNIQLYEVNEKQDIGDDYFSNENPEDYYNDSDPEISDSIIHNRGDSTYKIKLTQNFTEKLTNRTFETIDDTLSFMQAIPGIVFVPGNKTGEGSLMAAPISNCNMYLYRTTYPTDTTTAIDTIEYSINSEFNIRFNMFEHDYSKATATPNINTSLNSEEEDSLLFIQNLQGTRAKINFLEVDKIREKYKGKLIANASLILNTKQSYNPQDTILSNMTAHIYSEDSTYTRLNYYMQSVLGRQMQEYEGIYDNSNNEMVFNITGYYQSLLNKKVDESTIYLHTPNRGTSFNKIVLSGSNSSTPARLEIEYYNTSK